MATETMATETMAMEEPIMNGKSTKDTIFTIHFTEDNSQEDATYQVSEIEQKLAEQASLEESSTKDEEEEEEESCEDLQLEQVPIGVTEIVTERNNKVTTGEMLVFNDTDEPVQTLNEVSFDSEGEEEDASFEPTEPQEEDTQSETESVDQDDLKDLVVVENGEDMKLKFTDVEECRLKLQQEALSTEEITIEEDTQDYDEEADNDFNPTYCDQTLSDVEESEDPPAEQLETIELEDDIIMLKPDPTTKIPVMEEESVEESMEGDTMEDDSQEKESMEKESMECE